MTAIKTPRSGIPIAVTQTVKERHIAAHKKLQDIFNDKLTSTGLGISALLTKVAARLDSSAPNIRNYVEGRGGDGYMLDAITNEVEKL